MDGKGWKPEYGISPEGIEVLGFVEALPQDVRREIADAVANLCRAEGYLSLHDDLRAVMEKANGERARPEQDDESNVIQLFRRGTAAR